jgi:para-aminobenzoate synthetase component 1
MKLIKKLKWSDPISLASSVNGEQNWLFLHSVIDNAVTGNYSILALKQKSEVFSFAELEEKLSSDKLMLDNSWFGYLGYGLKNKLEKLAQDIEFKIELPDLWMANFNLILLFNHKENNIEVWSQSEELAKDIPEAFNIGEYQCDVSNLASNMTKDQYLEKVKIIQDAIKRGDLYQANLTRKFYGNIANAKPIAIFKKLCNISPSPYAAFIKLGNKYIISSSPERFLHIDKNGNVDTRPIKGSAPRFKNKKQDEISFNNLKNSVKDKAENLMIVDLSRNDISKNCVVGSVAVSDLFNITSYSTIHHMASTIKGKKLSSSSSLELVKGCFPPGSMTGAPKIKAMQLCSDLEKVKRGVYSGAIGYFAGDGSVDLSVVIRTLIIDGNNFEFQVGGAIVSDSDPYLEFEETITKAKAIASVLGLSLDELREL